MGFERKKKNQKSKIVGGCTESICQAFSMLLHPLKEGLKADNHNLGISPQALLPTSAGGAPLKTSELLNRTLTPLTSCQKSHLEGKTLYVARTLNSRSPCPAQSPFLNRRTSAGCHRPTIHHPTSVGRRHAEPSSPRISTNMPSNGSGKRPCLHMFSTNSRKQICSSRA